MSREIEKVKRQDSAQEDAWIRTAVYRIDIDAWSGKEKSVEPDFPGAYPLAEMPVPFPLDWRRAPHP